MTVSVDAVGSRAAAQWRAADTDMSVSASMAVTFSANAGMLVLNLFTGILTARLLNPAGRGEVAAVVTWALMVQLVASVGFKDALTFHQSRGAVSSARLLSTMLALVLALGAVGVVAAELLLPLGLSAQRADLLPLARVAVLMLVPIMAAEALLAMTHGQHRFVAAAAQRVGQPLGFASGLLVLWATGRISVASVLAVHALSWVLVATASLRWMVRRTGLAPPSPPVARDLLRYGIRLQGHSLGSLANARLDLVVMPAILVAREVGLYIVAVSAASVVMPLFAQLRNVVLAVAAASARDRALLLVERALRLALVGSLAVAAVLFVAAPWLVSLVYGDAFAGAVRPLRLLLPGIVAWSGAAIVAAGLLALNRPAAASAAQVGGVIVTVAGLAATLPTIGIEGAALTSSASYLTVLLLSLGLLAREREFSLRRTLAVRQVVADLRWGVRRVGERLEALRRPTSAVDDAPRPVHAALGSRGTQ